MSLGKEGTYWIASTFEWLR